MTNVHCIPPHIALDPFGRPIIIIETVPLDVELDTVKQGLLQFFERTRQNLFDVGKSARAEEDIPLQCVVILDLKNLTFQRAVSDLRWDSAARVHVSIEQGLDIMTWAIREVVPRFPGMLAGGIAFLIQNTERY